MRPYRDQVARERNVVLIYKETRLDGARYQRIRVAPFNKSETFDIELQGGTHRSLVQLRMG